MEYLWFVIPVVWVICGVINYGVCFAYFQREYPTIATLHYRSDMLGSILAAVFGPFATISFFPWWPGDKNMWKHGFKWK